MSGTAETGNAATMNREKISGGFADLVPAPLASGRHLRRLLYITIGIAIAMFLQARNLSPTPIASRVPLYFMLIGVELVLAWFVTIGVKARGYRLLDVVGKPWRNLVDAIGDVVVAAGSATLLRCSGPV